MLKITTDESKPNMGILAHQPFRPSSNAVVRVNMIPVMTVSFSLSEVQNVPYNALH